MDKVSVIIKAVGDYIGVMSMPVVIEMIMAFSQRYILDAIRELSREDRRITYEEIAARAGFGILVREIVSLPRIKTLLLQQTMEATG